MLKWFSSIFKSKSEILSETDIMKKFLVVGLGNIGAKYENTRHNIGFKVLDELSKSQEFTFEDAKLGAIASFKFKGKSILCLKPATYMNLSGKAVRYWMEKENIPLENVLIITDDINLSFGTIRLKTKGSDGGHNGLKDIQNTLQTATYNRFRFGVGADFGKGRQVDFVLGEWNGDEMQQMPERLKKATALILSFIFAGVKNTMNQFNGR
ncbi:aminoacyl-tRNA hydrolase [Croceitalea vernalis]|uniref:Peptidyl-tRNA hydrolase n=1 Tax=Croceitalea vernalis TaxID=3075599 RepID=A0ABU3BFD0_9FLAO|nr:aminoacyl-tRNA hydrolase [Croceitalea sp. P007]MDT0620853.1 aminoacyl-tRNA hydrolase [Croceitalea sp. P007]